MTEHFTRKQLESIGATFVADKALDMRGRVFAVKADDLYGILPFEYGYKPLFRVKPTPPATVTIRDGQSLSTIKAATL